MARHLHDPNNHAPEISEGDEWGDLADPDPAIQGSDMILPVKRKTQLHGSGRSRSPRKAEIAMRIDVKLHPRKSIPALQPTDTADDDDCVVKLEAAVSDAPFQASIAIPIPVNPNPEPSQLLHGEGREWGKIQKHSLRWLLITGLGVGVLVGLALTVQELFLIDRTSDPAETLMTTKEPLPEQVAGFEIDGSSEQQARSLLAAYAAAKTPEELAPLIRDAERLASSLTLNWHPWNVPPGWEVPFDAGWTDGAKGPRSHAILTGHLPDFSPFWGYFVREGDALKVDFEATEALGDTSFSLLSQGKGSGGVVRAFVQPDHYHSLNFPETDFRSFRVLSPDSTQVVWGYVKIGSPEDVAMQQVFEFGEILEATQSALPMIIRLTAPPDNSLKNQWIIREMLHNGWVSP